jgi:hypothetical protein
MRVNLVVIIFSNGIPSDFLQQNDLTSDYIKPAGCHPGGKLHRYKVT